MLTGVLLVAGVIATATARYGFDLSAENTGLVIGGFVAAWWTLWRWVYPGDGPGFLRVLHILLPLGYLAVLALFTVVVAKWAIVAAILDRSEALGIFVSFLGTVATLLAVGVGAVLESRRWFLGAALLVFTVALCWWAYHDATMRALVRPLFTW